MKDVLDEAKRLKNSAKANKEIADTENDPESYVEALEDLEMARGLLIAELSSIEEKLPVSTEFENNRRQNVALELADCFGLAGGIHRRKGEFDDAIRMYDKGYEYERNPDYNIQDSYNMTNRIVLRILNAPQSFESLTPMIEEATSIVQRQVEGKRRKEWWAWADLGLLYILDRNEKQALESYRDFKNNGALPKHYDSSIAVLLDLNEKLGKVAPAISSSITKAIDFLKLERPDS
jgi:tetratricopeptide (TPR) repeat protein